MPDFLIGADPCDQQSSRSSWIRSATGGETQGTAMAMGGYPADM